MRNSQDTSYASNLASFEKLISVCVAAGDNYNPARPELKVDQLQSNLLDNFNKATTLKEVRTAFENAVNARSLAFEPLKTIATRVKRALQASGASVRVVDDARLPVLKLQGRRSKAVKPAAAETASTETTSRRTVSASQQAYENRLDNLQRLITVLAAEPSYTPNEPELSIEGLRNLLTELLAKNTAVATAESAYKVAMDQRNALLTNSKTGLVVISLAVKNYLYAAFGAESVHYRSAAKLRFKR